MLNEHAIEIPCPDCGRKTAKTVAWIKAHEEFTCGGCGKPVHLQRDKFLKAIGDAEEALRELMWNPKRRH